ncbi:hypothetical protein [Pelomonas cellulosilytica]|uniref:Uncharacterized protein n=1 Tax=Pelomonas cellulosilytica TaxID=2906762 RepID=A0ABS8Y2C1_9BURK|nr:hypothetical protein [Pelomonas sp. P8]MCE4557815.1 hypothetical protein [Pelomonas sp. P8]
MARLAGSAKHARERRSGDPAGAAASDDDDLVQSVRTHGLISCSVVVKPLWSDREFALLSFGHTAPLVSAQQEPLQAPVSSQRSWLTLALARPIYRTRRQTVTKKLVPHARKLSLLAICACLAACGGGGGDGGSAGGRAQFITLAYPGGGELGQVKKLSATTTSGLPVTFSTSTPDFCTVAGDQLTLVKAGECRVVASQPGGKGTDGSQWAAADDVSQLFNVLKHEQQPDVPYAVMLRLGTATVELSATTRAGVAATYTSVTPQTCTVSGRTLTVLAAGACGLGVTAAANNDYSALTAGSALIAVSATPPFVVAAQGQPQSVVLAAVDKDGKAMSYQSKTPAVCAVAGGSLRLTAKGLCSVTASAAGGGDEELQMYVDPRFFASGFSTASTNPSRTVEQGDIATSAGFPDASWCGAVTPSYCNPSVSPISATFSYDIKPASNSNWKGDFSWSYFSFEIGAPMARNGSSFDLLPFDLKTEESLYVGLAVNQTLADGKEGIFVRIQTNHLLKKKDGNDCYVTASVHLVPTTAALVGYVIPLKDFAITDKCESDDLPQTEGWMFDWGVSAESKAAALDQLRAYGIRRLQFAPVTLNSKRPTANADGSVPTDPKDPAYTLTTGITVMSPITVQ